MPQPPLVEKAISSLLSSPGETELLLRREVFERVRSGSGDVPEELAALVEKIAYQPWSVRDEDVLRAREAGYSENQLYELILAAAAGAGIRRIEAGLRALEEA